MISICSRNLSEFVNRIDTSAIKYKVQKFSVITGLALAALASLGFAHAFPVHYTLTLATVSYLSIQTLPLVIDRGNVKLIKLALACYFISFNCLMLGGLGESFLQIPNTLKSMIGNVSPWTALAFLFMSTAWFGNGAPILIASLEKLMEILKNPQWEFNIGQIQKELRLLSNGVHLSAQSFGSKMLAFFYLLAPKYLLNPFFIFSNLFHQSISGEGLLLNAFFSSSNFEDVLAEIRGFSHRMEISNYNRLTAFFYINYAMRLIPENSAENQIDFLFDQAKWLVSTPTVQNGDLFLLEEGEDTAWMSPILFISLFHGRFYEIIRSKIDKLKNNPDEIACLQSQTERLIDEVDLISSKEIFAQKQNQILEEFSQLKQKIQILQLEKSRLNIYSNFSVLAKNSLKNGTPRTSERRLFDLFVEPSLIESHLLIDDSQLDQIFSDLKNLQSSVNKLSQKIENLNTKYRLGEIEDFEPVRFLGANKCGFIFDDFLILKDLFGLNELDEEELNERFREVGLASEEDFYTKGILLKCTEIDKSTLHANLKKLIGDRKVVDANDLPNKSQKSTNYLVAIKQTISKLIYNMITKGLILVPCLINPTHFLYGFCAGGVYFSLVKFGALKPIALANLSTAVCRLVYYVIFRRGLLSSTPVTQQNSQMFCNNNIFRKVVLISNEIFFTLFFVFESKMGSAIQGFELGYEVVDLCSKLKGYIFEKL